MATVTRTRTHVFTFFADPFIACAGCREFVISYHDHERCGCGEAELDRCSCGGLDFGSVCPSWGPEDGCTCTAAFGHVPHNRPANVPA